MKRLAAYAKIKHIIERKFSILMNMQTIHSNNIELFNRLKAEKKFISAINSDDKEAVSYEKNVKVDFNAFILEHYKNLLTRYFEVPFSIPVPSLPFSKEQAAETANKAAGGGGHICFVPFTTSRNRNWNPENFVYIARRIRERSGKKIVVLGRGKSKVLKNCFAGITNVINLFNKTSLSQAMRIAAASQYALTTDTSLMHCAVIGGANCICVSCGNDNKLFVEYPADLNVKQTVIYPEFFDSLNGVHYSNLDINSISAEKVWNEVKERWAL
jgi:ADP-heptose:LPS heptosyltransferase